MTVLPRLHFTSLGDPEIIGDIIESYRLAAEKLGFATSYAPRQTAPDAINLLFFCMTVSPTQIAALGPNVIVVNFEQLQPGSVWLTDSYLTLLRQNYVWEYSLTNFTRYREMGILNADHVPLGYEADAAPVRDTPPGREQDIDVVFYGTLSQRRLKVLQQLEARGLRVVYPLTRWTAEERDGYLQRAKLVLNMHVYASSRIVEIPRLSLLFRHQKAVVCELYPDSEIEPALREAIVGAPLEQLADTCEALLRDTERRQRLETAGLALFSQRTQMDILRPALQRYFQWRDQQIVRRAPTILPLAQTRKVSIIVPAWQAAKHLQDTLESIARQSHRQIEILLVNDGSTDQTSLIARALGLRQLRVLNLPVNSGVATARNVGLAAASGHYIAMWDADDLCEPERLAKQCAFLEAQPPIDVVGTWAAEFGARHKTHRYPELDHEIRAGFLGANGLLGGSLMLRRDFIERHGLRFDANFTVAEDLHFQFRCAVAGARFANLPEALYRYRIHPGNTHSRDQTHSLLQLGAARRWLLPYLFPHLNGQDLALFARFYSYQWADTQEFVEAILDLVARTLAQPPALGLETATATRVLRVEVVRMLLAFRKSGLLTPNGMTRIFTSLPLATFLAPARDWLYA